MFVEILCCRSWSGPGDLPRGHHEASLATTVGGPVLPDAPGAGHRQPGNRPQTQGHICLSVYFKVKI